MSDEANRIAEIEALDLSLERRGFFAVACERERDGLAVGPQPRHCIDQEVGALDMPELTDIDHIGRVIGRCDGVEFVGGHAVEDAFHEASWRADDALIGIARECAFEQEKVGAVHQSAFEAAVKRAL